MLSFMSDSQFKIRIVCSQKSDFAVKSQTLQWKVRLCSQKSDFAVRSQTLWESCRYSYFPAWGQREEAGTQILRCRVVEPNRTRKVSASWPPASNQPPRVSWIRFRGSLTQRSPPIRRLAAFLSVVFGFLHGVMVESGMAARRVFVDGVLAASSPR